MYFDKFHLLLVFALESSDSTYIFKIPVVQNYGYMASRPIHFQPMQIQPLQFQPLTISTYCIFNRPQFRPKLILANGS